MPVTRGDVVLAFVENVGAPGGKLRPAVVVQSDQNNTRLNETIIAAITSNTDRLLVGDHLIAGWQEAGLLFPSVATGVIRTVKQTMIERRLGLMPSAELRAIQERLRQVLGL